MENFGRYRILERLGAGALGELVRARDTRRGRTVALRIVTPLVNDDPARREALLSDAERSAIQSKVAGYYKRFKKGKPPWDQTNEELHAAITEALTGSGSIHEIVSAALEA